MIRKVILTEKQSLSAEQIARIEKAAEQPIVYDEDCPELTPAMEKAFRLAAQTRNRLKKGSAS